MAADPGDMGAHSSSVREPMVWSGATMFLLTLPTAAITSVGGPLMLVNDRQPTLHLIGSQLLLAFALHVLVWLALAVFCTARRPMRNRAERVLVSRRPVEHSLLALAESSCVGVAIFSD